MFALHSKINTLFTRMLREYKITVHLRDFHVLPYELVMFRMYGAGAAGTFYSEPEPEPEPEWFPGAGAGAGTVPN